MPSAFSMTFGVLPSITATHELVVPRSMPMTLPMVLDPLLCGGAAGPFNGTRAEGFRAANAALSEPLNYVERRPRRRFWTYRRALWSRKAAVRESAGQADMWVIGPGRAPIAHGASRAVTRHNVT